MTLHQLQQIQTRIKLTSLHQAEYIGGSGTSLAVEIPTRHFSRSEGAVQLQDWGHISKHRERTPAMAVQADSCHIFSLTLGKKKNKLLNEHKTLHNACHHYTNINPEAQKRTEATSQGAALFFLGISPIARPPRRRGEGCVRVAREAFCPNYLIYSWACLNSNGKNHKSWGSDVTNSCADVRMGNLQTNCPQTICWADRLPAHWLCVLFCPRAAAW